MQFQPVDQTNKYLVTFNHRGSISAGCFTSSHHGNMIRLHPTAISLTMPEVKELENRRRYRRYLQREENSTSEATVHRKTSSSLDQPPQTEPWTALSVSYNREAPCYPSLSKIPSPPTLSVPLRPTHDKQADGECSETLELAATSPDTPSSVGRYLSMRPRRHPLFSSPADNESLDQEATSESSLPTSDVVDTRSRNSSETTPPEPTLEPARAPRSTVFTAGTPGLAAPSLPPPFSQTPRRTSQERTFTLVSEFGDR